MLSSAETYFLTGSQQYTSKMLWLIFKMTIASQNGPRWQQGFRWRCTRTRWHCWADGHLLLLLQKKTQEILERGRHAPTNSAEQKPKQNTQEQSLAKVTASWQISAADESLTWGCWIDNLSMGTLLAFSSFWQRGEHIFAVKYQIHSQQQATRLFQNI